MPLDLGLRNRTAQGLRNLWKALLPVFRVTRREVQDSLRDWRIVVPIVILVLGFPVLADFVAQRGLRFVSQYGANLVAERLFPFLILVVGFFPSTFALVIALESFVGEKERRSLEPLLTTPLSDVQLYLGKLLASTLVPVGASYLGIIASVVLLGVTVGWWPGFSMLLLAFALSAVQALVMVAAAVIVSSQSTSVRAANLLASFIIVPMALLLQVDAGLLLYGDERGLWFVTLALFVVSVLLVRLGTRLFSRERLLGEDLDELDLLSGIRLLWQAALPEAGVLHVYQRDLPRLLKNLRCELLLTGIVLIGGSLSVGGWLSARFPLPAVALQMDTSLDLKTLHTQVSQVGLLPALTPSAILWHNVKSLGVTPLLGLLSLGTLAQLLLLVPGTLIAYLGFQMARVISQPWMLLVITVLPHGLFELPAAVLATAQATRVGTILLRSPEEGGGVLGIARELGHFVKFFVIVVLPLLTIAALIEASVTPRLLIWWLNRGG